MHTSDQHDEVNQDRRRFLGVAAAGAAAATALPLLGAARPARAAVPPASAQFGPVRQVKAGVLNTGYVEAGPASGPAVILMHGFPYDIHSYVQVAPLLAAEGYRVIVPYFRGYGTTTFLSAATPRNVDQAAFALDILALMDALGIREAILAGYDWGSRTGDIIAALWPRRCTALVSVSGYLITNLAANAKPLPPQAENDWWYQYYFCTERGVLGLTEYRYEFGEFVWKFNSPTWNFTTATYDQTAAAFDNPDYVPIVIGNYRWRLGHVPGGARVRGHREAPAAGTGHRACPPSPSTAKYDPFTPAGDGSAYRAKFTGKYDHRVLDVGHNVPQEDPSGFAQAVIDACHL